jgi:hypothetical protein
MVEIPVIGVFEKQIFLLQCNGPLSYCVTAEQGIVCMKTIANSRLPVYHIRLGQNK